MVGIVGLVAGGVLAGCLGEDVSAEPPVTTTDAGGEASSDGSAQDGGGGSGGTSVLPRGDFESGGCLGWTANEARLELDPAAHGGSFACRVCASGDTAVWGVFQDVANVAPGTYAGVGYMRASGDAGPFTTVLRLQATAGGAEVGDQREGSATHAPGETYAEAKAEIAIESGQGVSVAVLAQQPGGCFLVDDVTLVKR